MRERPHQFGAHGNLFGVLSEPDPALARPGAPAVLFSNTGIHHHVGPNRIWVELARALAARGLSALRFDLSGLGDSGARPGQEGERERAILDFRDAMDLVAKRRGASSFVLVGLCSGADAVHAAALADPRVAGAVYVDGFAWRTPGFWLRLPLRKIELRRWRRRLKHLRALRLAKRLGAEEILVRDLPTPERFRADLGALVARGTRVLAVYSGALVDYSYAAQFEDMVRPVDLRGCVESAFFPLSDHLFTPTPHREAFVERIGRWVEDQFPVAEGAARASASR